MTKTKNRKSKKNKSRKLKKGGANSPFDNHTKGKLFTPSSKQILREAILIYCEPDHDEIRSQYPIGNWNVSNITDMSNLFRDCDDFDENISSWNVSNVTNMRGMFAGCVKFNQPLGYVDADNPGWNVSKVTNMGGMFAGCVEFNQPLNSWNVSNVTNMASMFDGCIAFNQSLCGWNISKVEDMTEMFSGATAFNQSLKCWKIAYGTHIDDMFKYTQIDENKMPILAKDPLAPETIYENTDAVPLESSTEDVNKFLNENPDNIVFYMMNKSSVLRTTKSRIRNQLLLSDSILFSCNEGSIHMEVPYVDLSSFTSQMALVSLSSLKTVLEDTSIRIVEIVTPFVKKVTEIVTLKTMRAQKNECKSKHQLHVYKLRKIPFQKEENQKINTTEKKRKLEEDNDSPLSKKRHTQKEAWT